MGTPIKYQGTFQDATGYGAANRAFVTALYVAGVDVTTDLLVQTKDRTSFGWEGELCHQLLNRTNNYKVKIVHLTPDLYKDNREEGIYNIGHLFWETDRLPDGWAKECNKMGEIWTSSQHMVNLFKANGVHVPIYWFPQPIDTTLATKQINRFSVAGHNGLMFYSIFQWIDRKNPKALIQAYWEAFTGRDDVSLLLKTFRFSYDESEYEKIRDDIRAWKKEVPMTHYPKILLVNKIMSHERVMKIHSTGDCYVQTDRGEGWSRTVQEALLMGKPVIATGRGGIHEYLNEDHYFRIPSKYVPVKENPLIKFYTSDQKWAEIDKNKLVKAFQYVYNNRVLAGAKGIVGQKFVTDNFSYHKVGQMMRERLEVIYKGL